MAILSVKSIPILSIADASDIEKERFLENFYQLPRVIRQVASSAKTGAYIVGLGKHFQIPLNTTSAISFAVFSILSGEKTLAQLPALLSSKLQISNDKAQAIAKEIEKELIAPVSGELNRYLANKRKSQGSISTKISQEPGQKPPVKAASQPSTMRSSPTKPAPQEKTTSDPRKIPNRPAVPPNILDLKKKWEQPKPPSIPN